MDHNKAVKAKIIALRKSKGVTQETISVALGMAQGNYSRMERGSYELTINQLADIASYFQISVEDLVKYDLPNESLIEASTQASHAETVINLDNVDIDPVASRIVEARRKKGFTQEQVADILSMTRSNYAYLERRGRLLTVEQVETIANALSVTSFDLMGSVVVHHHKKRDEYALELLKSLLMGFIEISEIETYVQAAVKGADLLVKELGKEDSKL
jgi:transcriptional regulator with XRE-family HTH domain